MDSCIVNTEFIKRDMLTLNYLRSKKSKELVGISKFAAEAYINTTEKHGMNAYFEWPVDHATSGKELLIHIGGRIECQEGVINDITYFFAVSENKKVLRKYHFDYTNRNNPRRLPHPVFHLQLPGMLPPNMLQSGYDVNHLDPKLSEPRILYLPMSLALVMHMAFSEFKNENTDSIIKDGFWQGIIRTDQDALWKKYMEKCINIINNKKLVYDEAYRSN